MNSTMKVRGKGGIEQLDKVNSNGNPIPRSRCRRWRLILSTDAGKRTRRFRGTYSEAQDALRAFREEIEGLVPNGETFASYAQTWLAWARDSGRYAAGTIANYERDVRALSRVLGDVAMDAVTPEACKEALLSLKHGGSASGKELSNTYMAEMHGTLAQIMQTAEDDGRIARNPMAKLRAPRPDTPEKEWLEPLELALFLLRLDELPLTQWTMALYLISMLGLRRGEAVALQDSDVSISRDPRGAWSGTAHVHLAMKEANGKIEDPKTASGVRDLPMPARLCGKVAEWREIRWRRGLADAPTLACNVDGGAMRPQNLARWWRLHRDELGCHDMGLHQLRHSNLSMMARRMSPFDLKDWAGWSSIAPAKVYVHRDIDSLRAAVADAWEVVR